MRTAGREPVRPVLRAVGRKRRKPGVDAVAGRTVHTDTILREPENGGVAGRAGIQCEPEAGIATDGTDGNRGGLSEAEAQPAGRRSQDLPVPAERGGSGPRQSGVERRHYVYKNGTGFCLPGSSDGLVQPLRSELELVSDHGTRLLRRRAQVRATAGTARDVPLAFRSLRSTSTRQFPSGR